MLGPCADVRLFHQTVEGIVDQDYRGLVVGIVPNVMALDGQWALDLASQTRKIIVCRGSSELNCNSACAIALDLQPEAQFIALINCGERPPRKWLHSLKEVQEEFDADVVTGPVKSMFDEPPSDWMLASGYFDRCGMRFGPITCLPALDNSLIRSTTIRSCLPEIIPFHLPEADGIDFAYQLKMLGSVAVWANEAIVFNSVPKSRMNDEWLLERDFLRAYAVARVESRYRANRLADALRRVRACGLLLAGIAAYGVAPRDSLRARLMLARARGALAGSLPNRS
ncbi:hypothetical protein CQ12_28605 [Bradyrhizobium jicamae]|uniref:Glycosyltransferase 2-like domain-containing protein n=1 Tax=Bradyrhizobium jicamae TaxID=280332 RepID=A0A0R3M9Q1_9BRAD|nr:hypothetical protein CQ12_28605 [Bradyrhizobium jicamae]